MANTPYYTKAETNALDQELKTLLGTGYKGVIPTDGNTPTTEPAPTDDGLYFPRTNGTYTNFGGLVVDLSDTFTAISVENGQTNFELIEIPISLTIDATPTPESTNALQSGGAFNALALKASIDSPTFTGTVEGVTKAMVGLSDVENTADLDKPISTATQNYIESLIEETTQNVNTEQNINSLWTQNLVVALFSDITKTYSFINYNAGLYAELPNLINETVHPFDYNGFALKLMPTNAFDQISEFKLVFPVNPSLLPVGKAFTIEVDINVNASGTQPFEVRNTSGATLVSSASFAFTSGVTTKCIFNCVSTGSSSYYLMIPWHYNFMRNKTVFIGINSIKTLIAVTTPATILSVEKFEQEKTDLLEYIDSADATLQSQIDNLQLGVVDFKRPLPLENLSAFTVYNDNADITTTSAITSSKSVLARITGFQQNPLFSYSCPVTVSSTFPYSLTENIPNKIGYLCEFDVDTRQIEFVGMGTLTRFRVVVDNVIVTEQKTLPSPTDLLHYRIDFGTKAKRNIKLSIFGQFFGVKIDADGVVTAVDNSNKLRLIAEGDSTVEGTSASLSNMQLLSWAGIVAQKLNYNLINSAIGGTGYLQTFSGKPNMYSRIQTYVIDLVPDVFIASMGYNDLSLDLDTVKENIDLYWDKIKTDLPNTKSIVCGLFNNNATTPIAMDELNEHLRIVAKRNGFPFIDIYNLKTYDALGNKITDGSGKMITGTGRIGTPSNPINGNRSFYIIADNIHPSIEMHRYVGVWVTNEIYKLFKNNIGEINDELIFRG